jgi:hypothetical protein
LLALCFSANFCFGQEPIVEIKVSPEKRVFKNSAWNKPIVIKSQDEAAKHFGKDALDAIAKKVDFKKQIVLLFAWQGSGGDKLPTQGAHQGIGADQGGPDKGDRDFAPIRRFPI